MINLKKHLKINFFQFLNNQFKDNSLLTNTPLVGAFSLSIFACLNYSNHQYATIYPEEVPLLSEVVSIYNSLSDNGFSAFLNHLFDGSEMRYGRITFYLRALIGLVPDKVWTGRGLIISLVTLQSFTLILSIYIFGITFLAKKKLRFLFFFAALFYPAALYHQVRFKTESFQLFFLSLYFYSIFKKNYGYPYLFLSIALFVKVTSAPIVITLLMFTLFASYKNTEIKLSIKIKRALESVLYFILGLIIVYPSILIENSRPIITAIYGASAWHTEGQIVNGFSGYINNVMYNLNNTFVEFYFSGYIVLFWAYVVALVLLFHDYLRLKKNFLQILEFRVFVSSLFLILFLLVFTKNEEHFNYLALTMQLVCLLGFSERNIEKKRKVVSYFIVFLIFCITAASISKNYIPTIQLMRKKSKSEVLYKTAKTLRAISISTSFIQTNYNKKNVNILVSGDFVDKNLELRDHPFLHPMRFSNFTYSVKSPFEIDFKENYDFMIVTSKFLNNNMYNNSNKIESVKNLKIYSQKLRDCEVNEDCYNELILSQFGFHIFLSGKFNISKLQLAINEDPGFTISYSSIFNPHRENK